MGVQVFLNMQQLHEGSLRLPNKGLFEMIVGVLTTCHTQYT